MTETNQRVGSHPSSLSREATDLPPTTSFQEPFIFPHSSSPIDSFAANQKIEIVCAQGHRLCLQGSFDWNELRTWLTPLFTQEESEETGSAN